MIIMVGDSYLEDLYYKYCEDEPNNEEGIFYYERIYEDIKLFARPELVDDVEDHFIDLLLGHSIADSKQAFKRGFRLAAHFMSECMDAYTENKKTAESRYNSSYSNDVARHDRLKALAALNNTKDGAE